MTRLLLTKIPFFKEIIVSSFACENCGWVNNEIQSAGKIQEEGVQYKLLVSSKEDLNREVVKADCATTKIPELDFEIPPLTQKGALSTVEGLIDRAVAGLEQDQPTRKATDPEVALKIEEFIEKLMKLKDVKVPFTLIIDDPSGNSFVENPYAPQKDEALLITQYKRDSAQDSMLGLQACTEEETPQSSMDDLRNEVLQFGTNCPECNAPAETNMKLVRILRQSVLDPAECFPLSTLQTGTTYIYIASFTRLLEIPHFKEVIIMATNCEACGHRTNEVKSGGATEPLGTKITLRITDPSDMSRDLLKSETCAIFIPELEFELGMGILGGKFTTLEGLLTDVKELIVVKNPFIAGDSSAPERSEKLREFGQKLNEIISGKREAHIILRDSAGNSYLQNLYAPDPDPEMKIEKYERTFEDNEELGLNDMNTEDYKEQKVDK
ncbi:zinc finger protein ZPR1 isoform X1 [Mustelus asterias]